MHESHYKKKKKLAIVVGFFCGGFEKRCYKSHIVALFRSTPIYEIYCSIQLDRHNRSTLLRLTTAAEYKTATIYIYIYIYILATLDIVIVVLHQTVAIDISFCGILQRRNIKPPQ